jgi:hypothetical protein
VSRNVRRLEEEGVEGTDHCSGVGGRDDLPGEQDIINCIGGDITDYDCRNGGVDSERKLFCWASEFCCYVICLDRKLLVI